MKYLPLAIILLFIQCSQKQKEGEQLVYHTSDIKEEKQNILFPEYVFKSKDTITKTLIGGGSSETIIIGKFNTDSIIYTAISQFRYISVANGFRGKSTFYLAALNRDTLNYDGVKRSDLPIDIYQNNFVFETKKGDYTFGPIDLIIDEALCFAGNHNQCLTW